MGAIGKEKLIYVGLPPGKRGKNIKITGDVLALDIQADELAAAVGDKQLAYYHQSITSGIDVRTGGTKPQVTARTAALPGRRSQYRGYRSGELADDMERRTVSGDNGKAKTTITHPEASRQVFLSREYRNNIQHIGIEGVARQKLEDNVLEFVAEGVGPSVKIKRGRPKRKRIPKKKTTKGATVPNE